MTCLSVCLEPVQKESSSEVTVLVQPTDLSAGCQLGSAVSPVVRGPG